MDPNKCSPEPTASPTDDLATLEADLANLAQDRTCLPAAVKAQRILRLRRLVDQLEGHWLSELADVDACGAAGAEQGIPAPSTAGWLRTRLHLGPGAATSMVRTARAVFRGPLTRTGQALTDGEVSAAHPRGRAPSTPDLAAPTAVAAEPILLEAAGRLDPPRAGPGRRPPPAGRRPRGRRPPGRATPCPAGLWPTPTLEGMVVVDGLLAARGRPDRAAGLGAAGPPPPRRRHRQRWPAPGRCPR